MREDLCSLHDKESNNFKIWSGHSPVWNGSSNTSERFDQTIYQRAKPLERVLDGRITICTSPESIHNQPEITHECARELLKYSWSYYYSRPHNKALRRVQQFWNNWQGRDCKQASGLKKKTSWRSRILLQSTIDNRPLCLYVVLHKPGGLKVKLTIFHPTTENTRIMRSVNRCGEFLLFFLSSFSKINK